MMKTADFTYLFILLLSLAFFPFTTCDRNIQNEKIVTNTQENPDFQLPAMFSGTLPCADCPGIHYRLIIEEDKFTAISIYQNQSPGRSKNNGTWLVEGDTLQLKSNNITTKKFLIEEKQLTLLDKNNQQSTGNLADQYVLERVGNQESIRKHHQELADRGFEFFANGNEPFWSLKINSQNKISFETPDSTQTFEVADSTQANGSVVIEAKAQSRQITIQATNSYCQDSMSGYLFPRTVTIYLQTARTDTLSGCGLFLNH